MAKRQYRQHSVQPPSASGEILLVCEGLGLGCTGCRVLLLTQVSNKVLQGARAEVCWNVIQLGSRV